MKIHPRSTLSSIIFVFALAACSSAPAGSDADRVPAEFVVMTMGELPTPVHANSREIVFIHGMFMTPKCWDGWMQTFEKQGYKVSAPAWPLHEGSVDSLRAADRLPALGLLELSTVLDHYRQILKTKKQKPILVGHSMGGLISQILLGEGLADSAIVIDSAAPKGVISLKFSFLKSNWGVINPFATKDQPLQMDLDAFSYSFANVQNPLDQQRLFNSYYVPESRRVGKDSTTDVAKIDFAKARGPLLFLAGEEDHIIPASLNLKNFKEYDATSSFTEYTSIAGRDHSTILSPGWEQVASKASDWLTKVYGK